MSPFHYKARILPDGHLPLPESFPGRAGEEVEVTLLPTEGGDGTGEAEERADHLIKKWAGRGQGSGKGVAEHHDDHLYGQ